MDDLFDDDEAAPPAKEESRADKMAAAKAAKDAKKKIDRYSAGNALNHFRLSCDMHVPAYVGTQGTKFACRCLFGLVFCGPHVRILGCLSDMPIYGLAHSCPTVMY